MTLHVTTTLFGGIKHDCKIYFAWSNIVECATFFFTFITKKHVCFVGKKPLSLKKSQTIYIHH